MKPLLLTVLCLLLAGSGWASDIVPIETIMLEARGESLQGQIAVGEVIRNRAFKAQGTFEGICMAPRQFSAWNQPLEAKRTLSTLSGKTWQVASKAWEASSTSLQTRGATHYHTKAVRPYWAVGHTPCAVIGNHRFYNDIR